MSKTYTTKTAPVRLAELGRTGADDKLLEPVSVRSLAQKHDIGIKLGRDWLFTEGDLVAMAALPGPGRPAVSTAKDAPASTEADNDAHQKGDEKWNTDTL